MANTDFIESLILKGMRDNKNFLIRIMGSYKPEYFSNRTIGKIFEFTVNHLREYKTIPSDDIILNGLSERHRSSAADEIEKAKAINVTVEVNGPDEDYLLEETNKHLQEKAIKQGLFESVQIVENQGNISQIREIITDSLCKDLKMDLGLDYFSDMESRLREVFTRVQNRVRSYFPSLDEIINGGFPPYTLSVFLARIHGGKSNLLINMAARQALHGKNAVIASCEMSEEMVAQRLDSIYTELNTNRIYICEDTKRQFIQKIIQTKRREGLGCIKIKEFPTGAASANDFRMYLRELTFRGIVPDVLFCDYINLMRPESTETGQMYSDVKRVSEELRALGKEFHIPVISVSQLNREGTFTAFEDLDWNFTGESLGIPATADFLGILGQNEDDLIYKSEIHSKITKNRLGGRIGDVHKFYLDSKSLKMYDEIELDDWIAAASYSGDERERAEERTQHQRERRRRA